MNYNHIVMNNLKHLLFLVFACNISIAQEQQVILPSPETSALFRYQDYPMDYSTGLPQISIPLFEIQNGSLKVPISISYHASGCRVSEVDGPIAVGWSLSVGGMISRTINGSSDFEEFPFPSPFSTNLTNSNNLATLERIMHYDSPWSAPGQWLDSEYDIFSFSFGDHSGKFLFKDEDGEKTPILLPYKPLTIIPITNPIELDRLKITDLNGDNYTFSGTESSNAGKTGYTLSQIVSASLKDTINYSYSSTPQYRRHIGQSIVVEDQWDSGFGQGANISTTNLHDNSDYYSVSRLMEIDFEQGKLEFVLIGGAGPDNDLIDFIQLKDRNGNLLKKIKFIRSSLHSISILNFSTHKLNGIEIQDKYNNTIENYSFDYYSTVYSGNGDGNGIIDPRYIDFWGYYNASGKTEMIYHPDVTIQGTTVSSPTTQTIGTSQVNRNPNLMALKSGVLRKITFPTGGHSEFIFETNKYYSLVENQKKDGPGLRVKEIITSDAIGNTYKRTYKYGVGEIDYGYIDMEPTLDKMMETVRYKYYPQSADHRERTFYSGFVPSLEELSSRPVIYGEVTEYKGNSTNNEGKTVYEYDNYQWGLAGLGSGQDGLNRWHISNYKFWDKPELSFTTDYESIKDINGVVTSYEERRKLTNIFNTITNYSEDIIGLHVQRRYRVPQTGLIQGTQYTFGEEAAIGLENLEIYAIGEYRIPIGTKNLTTTTEKLSNDDGSTITTSTSYGYNTQNLISEVNTITSKVDGTTLENKILKKEITYPFDYNISVLNQMTNLNMINYKVGEKNYLDGALLNQSITDYKDWDNDPIEYNFLPEYIKNTKSNGVLEPRVVFHGYDAKGNPKEISTNEGPHVYYIWGYHDTRPIAKIDNFTQSQANGIQSLINAAITASDLDIDNCKDSNCKEQELRDALALVQNNGALNSAQMTYFTYDPLIGATSVTDARGNTIYFIYDSFNRLKEVRDSTGNIINDYEYNYKQPISN